MLFVEGYFEGFGLATQGLNGTLGQQILEPGDQLFPTLSVQRGLRIGTFALLFGTHIAQIQLFAVGRQGGLFIGEVHRMGRGLGFGGCLLGGGGGSLLHILGLQAELLLGSRKVRFFGHRCRF